MELDHKPQPVIKDALEMELDAAAVLDGKMDQMTFAQLIGNTAMHDPEAFAKMAGESQADYRNNTSIPGAHIETDEPHGKVTAITFERHDSHDDHFKPETVRVGLAMPPDINARLFNTYLHTSNMEHPDQFEKRHPEGYHQTPWPKK